MKKSIFKAGFDYFCVVLAGFLIDLLVFTTLVHLEMGIVAANATAFLTGSACNALLVRVFVFEENRFSLGIDVIMTFLTNVLVFMAGTALLAWLVKGQGLQLLTGKLISNAMTLIVNFAIRATFFRKF